MHEDQPTQLPQRYVAGDWVTYRDDGAAVEVLMDLGEGLLRVRTYTSERTIHTCDVRPATEAEQQAAVKRRAHASRFRAAGDRLRRHGLTDEHLLIDIGAGYTELDYYLRAEFGFRGRYVPADVWGDGSFDLASWVPPRSFDWYAALEVVEHVEDPRALVDRLKEWAGEGFVLTTPNKEVVDVFAQDPTHLSALDEETLQSWGMATTLHNFYGHHQDGICAVWTRRLKDRA